MTMSQVCVNLRTQKGVGINSLCKGICSALPIEDPNRRNRCTMCRPEHYHWFSWERIIIIGFNNYLVGIIMYWNIKISNYKMRGRMAVPLICNTRKSLEIKN